MYGGYENNTSLMSETNTSLSEIRVVQTVKVRTAAVIRCTVIFVANNYLQKLYEHNVKTTALYIMIYIRASLLTLNFD